MGGDGGRVACKVSELQKKAHISLAGNRPPGKDLSHKTPPKKSIFFWKQSPMLSVSKQRTYNRPTLP